MPSPFPGMDPYLEGYLWPDVHHRLATKIGSQLAPKLQPNYVARLELSMVEDTAYESEIGVMYPDVEIVRVEQAAPLPPGPSGGIAVIEPVAATAPLTITIPQVRLVSVEIRDTANNQLVTSIEIISPVNKREPNLSKYRAKRDRLRSANVHLLEIDLLRRGDRVWEYPGIPDAAYVMVLTRAADTRMDIWPLALADPLPNLPVPLRPPDADVLLNLSTALNAVYDEAYYHLSIDYQQAPPPPELTSDEQAWVKEMLNQVKRET